MIKNTFSICLILCTVILLSCRQDTAPVSLAGTKPNIIFVLTDDQGKGDFSSTGNPILKTPHLDQFRAQSLRFEDFHVSPTCSPTRAALMSGRHPFDVGVTHTVHRREQMSLDVITLPQTLKTAGYATGLFGKWHLGDAPEYLPQNRGFDEVLMHGAGGIGQTTWGDFPANEENTYFDNVLLHNQTVVQTKGFCTDLFFHAALAWIKEQHQLGNPYFAYLALNAPHSPMIAPESYKKRFLEMGYDDKTAGRLGMIENIDDNMGLLMEKLNEWDALDNTLVIFMTDNGMNMSRVRKTDGSEQQPFNAGMRGGKGSAFEGGTRVPSFWFWQDKLPGGTEVNALTAHIDFYPTLCSLAGVPVPEGRLQPNGRSLVPLLENAHSEWADRKLFIHRGRWGHGRASADRDREACRYFRGAVRTQKWRLVFDIVNNEVITMLFDISKDPGETTNLAEQHPEVLTELKQSYDAWWESTEPYLINEDLPPIPSDQYPFHLLYQKQINEKGVIPDWSPKSL